MRILSLSAAAFCLLLAAPASAQEAGGCDMLCRLKGYLSTDHMAGDAAGGSPADAPAKARRVRSTAVHKAAAAAKPVAAVTAPPAIAPGTASGARTAVKASAPTKRDAIVTKPAPVRSAAVVPPVPARAARPAAPKLVASAPSVAKPAVKASPVQAPTVVARVSASVAEPPKVRVAAAPRRAAPAPAAPASTPTRTASLSTAIPGSAPAMQAGFH